MNPVQWLVQVASFLSVILFFFFYLLQIVVNCVNGRGDTV